MINILLLIAAYLFMEFIAWSNHKFVMHGFLWIWHKDHHVNDQKKVRLEDLEYRGWEKNDYFFLVYAIPAIILMMTGIYFEYAKMIYISVGITLYGFTYFMVHDVIIHQRLNIPFLRHSHNAYTRAIIRAHLAHHRPHNASDFDNYGLLIFSPKYFKEEK